MRPLAPTAASPSSGAARAGGTLRTWPPAPIRRSPSMTTRASDQRRAQATRCSANNRSSPTSSSSATMFAAWSRSGGCELFATQAAMRSTTRRPDDDESNRVSQHRSRRFRERPCAMCVRGRAPRSRCRRRLARLRQPASSRTMRLQPAIRVQRDWRRKRTARCAASPASDDTGEHAGSQIEETTILQPRSESKLCPQRAVQQFRGGASRVESVHREQVLSPPRLLLESPGSRPTRWRVFLTPRRHVPWSAWRATAQSKRGPRRSRALAACCDVPAGRPGSPGTARTPLRGGGHLEVRRLPRSQPTRRAEGQLGDKHEDRDRRGCRMDRTRHRRRERGCP